MTLSVQKNRRPKRPKRPCLSRHRAVARGAAHDACATGETTRDRASTCRITSLTATPSPAAEPVGRVEIRPGADNRRQQRRERRQGADRRRVGSRAAGTARGGGAGSSGWLGQSAAPGGRVRRKKPSRGRSGGSEDTRSCRNWGRDRDETTTHQAAASPPRVAAAAGRRRLAAPHALPSG